MSRTRLLTVPSASRPCLGATTCRSRRTCPEPGACERDGRAGMATLRAHSRVGIEHRVDRHLRADQRDVHAADAARLADGTGRRLLDAQGHGAKSATPLGELTRKHEGRWPWDDAPNFCPAHSGVSAFGLRLRAQMAAPHEEAPLLRPAPRSRSRGVAAICACALLFVAAATRGTTLRASAKLVIDEASNVTAPEESANPNATVGPRVIASPPPKNQSAGEAEHPDYPGPPPPWHPFMPPAAPHPPAPSVAPAPTTYDSRVTRRAPAPVLAREPDAATDSRWVNDDDATPHRRRRRRQHRPAATMTTTATTTGIRTGTRAATRSAGRCARFIPTRPRGAAGARSSTRTTPCAVSALAVVNAG